MRTHTHTTHNELKVTNHETLMYKNQKFNLSVNVLLETDETIQPKQGMEAVHKQKIQIL